MSVGCSEPISFRKKEQDCTFKWQHLDVYWKQQFDKTGKSSAHADTS